MPQYGDEKGKVKERNKRRVKKFQIDIASPNVGQFMGLCNLPYKHTLYSQLNQSNTHQLSFFEATFITFTTSHFTLNFHENNNPARTQIGLSQGHIQVHIITHTMNIGPTERNTHTYTLGTTNNTKNNNTNKRLFTSQVHISHPSFIFYSIRKQTARCTSVNACQQCFILQLKIVYMFLTSKSPNIQWQTLDR